MSRRAYVDKDDLKELEIEVKLCPISGISCADCGYAKLTDVTYNCFLAHLIDVLEALENGGTD
ncbi:hypothetical protein ES705_31776 [subsurface metagenome]